MVYIFIALIAYTFALLFITAASRNINTNVATSIVNTISAIMPVLLVIPLISKKVITDGRFGIIMAVLGGISIAIFGMALAKSFSLNKVGVVAPIVFGGAILLSTVLSALIFKEKITMVEGLGLAVLSRMRGRLRSR